jgi:pimeloyl-ACP methyl ester carboxylesterase
VQAYRIQLESVMSNYSDSTVPVPGGTLFVRSWNNDCDAVAPIILLHDSLGSVELWRDFPAALARATARRVIAYDRLGFGQSTARQAPPGTNFIREEAEIYFPQVVKALGISEFLLFGHSVGGVMALTIAATDPRSCKLVVSESAQSYIEDRTLSGILDAKKLFAEPGQFEKLGKYHGDRARWVLDAWTETWLSPDFRSWSLDSDLGKVHCPVLAIHGDSDEYGSVDFPRYIAEKVGGPSRAEIMKDCGHLPHRQQLNEVLQVTAGFIQHHLQS